MKLNLEDLLIKPRTKIPDDVIWTSDYHCPKCGEESCDSDMGYKVKGEKYPIYINNRKGYNGSGDYYDWEEIHRCKKCKTKFVFTNGAY